MKGLCLSVSPDGAVFQIEGEQPIDGYYYMMEDAAHGSGAQQRAREALITEYWKSGLHPKYGGDPRDVLRDRLKISLGEGMERYHYGYFEGDKLVKGQAKRWDDIPDKCRKEYTEEKAFIVGKLKSFSKYTKKQQQRFLDNLINEMVSAGVNSKKFGEILEGMKSNEEKVREVFE
jgi:hypothetical protein